MSSALVQHKVRTPCPHTRRSPSAFDLTDHRLLCGDIPESLCVFVDSGDAFFEYLLQLKLACVYDLHKDLADIARRTGDPQNLIDRIGQFLESEDVFKEKMDYMLKTGLKWANIWSGYLKKAGWSYVKGKHLVDYVYLTPGMNISRVQYLELTHEVNENICILC